MRIRDEAGIGVFPSLAGPKVALVVSHGAFAASFVEPGGISNVTDSIPNDKNVPPNNKSVTPIDAAIGTCTTEATADQPGIAP